MDSVLFVWHVKGDSVSLKWVSLFDRPTCIQVLLLVAPMILMLIIPRLMKGMDPEDKKVSIIPYTSNPPPEHHGYI